MKKIKFLISIVVFILAIFILYNVRGVLIIPHLQNNLSYITKNKCYFSDISLEFPFKIAVHDLSYDKKIFIDKITFNISFVKLLQNYHSPFTSIISIDADNCNLIFYGQNYNIDKKTNTVKSIKFSFNKIINYIFQKLNLKIFIKNTKVFYNKQKIELVDISVKFGSEIKFNLKANYKSLKFDIAGNIYDDTDNLKSDVYADVEGTIKSRLVMKGLYDLDNNNFDFNIKTDKLLLSIFNLGKANINIKNNENGMSLVTEGEKLNFIFKTENFNLWTARGNLKLQNGNILSSILTFNVEKNKHLTDLTLFSTDTVVFNKNIGTVSVKAEKKQENTKIDITFDIDKSNISALVEPDGRFKADVCNRQQKITTLLGNYITKKIKINLQKCDVNKIPLVSSYKQVKGILSVVGDIDEREGILNFKLENLNSQTIRNTTFAGYIKRNNTDWIFNVDTSDKKIVLDGIYAGRDLKEINCSFKDIDIKTILKIAKSDFDISGYATGYIKRYENKLSQIKMNIKDGKLYGNAFTKADITADISKTNIDIYDFNFIGKDMELTLKSSLNFDKEETLSYFNCDIKNFKLKSFLFNSQINFNGKIGTRTNEIRGKLTIPKISINDVVFEDFIADIGLSLKQIQLRSFGNNNGLSGYLTYAFKEKTISSKIELAKTDLSKHHKLFKGNLSLESEIKGTVDNPEIETECAVKDGFFHKVKFSLNNKAVYKNHKGTIKAKLVMDKANINLSGDIIKDELNLNFKFSNLTETVINNYMMFRTPIKGIFNGDGTVTGTIYEPKILMNCISDVVYFKNIKLNQFDSQVQMFDKDIVVNKAKAKLKDSEINVNGKFNTKTGDYFSKFNFINLHVANFDLFGNIIFDGNMKRKIGGSTYKGTIEINNMWINREKIDSLPFDYFIANKKITLNTKPDNKLQISGGIDFTKYPKLIFDNLTISHNNQICIFDGSTSKDNININVNWNNLDSATMSRLFDLPFDVDGAVDFKLNASGSFLSPNILCSLKSKNGTIMDVPYDNADIDVKIEKNILIINKFNINKKNEYMADVIGFFPFWLDSSLKKEMMEKQVELQYEIKDDKLAMVKELTNQNVSVKNGNLKLKGTLTGIRKNIKNTGEMTITASNITAKNYINKVKKLTAKFIWEDSLAKIEEFEAVAGSGKINAEGSIKFRGLNPYLYDLTIFTSKKGVPVVIKELPIPTSGIFKIEKTDKLTNYSKGVPAFNFKINGKYDEVKITGWAELENTRFSYPAPDFIKKEDDIDFDELFENCYIDIDLKTASNTRFENSFADANIKGKVNIKGSLDNIIANGILQSNDGKVFYMGNDLNVVDSKIEIINNKIFVTCEAETEVYTAGDSVPDVVKVYVSRSSIDDFKTRFVSKNDPTLSSDKVLYKVTKTDPTTSTGSDTNTDFMVKQQIVRMFGSNVAVPLANTVLKKTGIVDNIRLGFVNQDMLQVDPNKPTKMADLLYGMKYSAEKNLNRLLQVGYSVTFDQVQEEIDLKHSLEMSVRLSNSIFLRGSYGLQSNNPDYEPENKIMLEQRIRFGGGKKKK